jgi:hypothetical protein
MDRTYAFVDESGNTDLDTSKGGSSGFFIVCSILVAEKDLDAAYAQAEELRKRHFQTGEIKSSNLKLKDSDRRVRILNELAELPFKLYLTVVDKSRIYKDGGLRIKTSFIKYVNGLLYERLFSAYPDLRMIVDEHGVRIPRHPATRSTNIRPPVPRSSGQAVGAQRRRFALLV